MCSPRVCGWGDWKLWGGIEGVTAGASLLSAVRSARNCLRVCFHKVPFARTTVTLPNRLAGVSQRLALTVNIAPRYGQRSTAAAGGRALTASSERVARSVDSHSGRAGWGGVADCGGGMETVQGNSFSSEMSVRRAGAHGGVASTTVGARLPAGRGARGRAALVSGVQVGARGGPGDAEIPRAHGERPPATPARRGGVERSEPGTRGLGRALGSGAELGFATLPGDLLRSRQKTQDSDIPGARFTRSISLHNIPLHSQIVVDITVAFILGEQVELAKAEAMLGSMNQPSAVKSTYTSESSSSNGRPDAFIEEELKKVGSLLQKNSSSSETFSSFGSSHPSSSNGSALGSSFASGSFQPNAAGKPASSSSYSFEYQGGAASKPAGSTYSFEHQSSASAKQPTTEYQSSAAGRPVSSSYSSEFNSSSAGAGPVNSYSSVEYQSGTSAKPMSTTYSSEFESSTAARPVSSTYSSEFNSSAAGAGPVNSYSSVDYQSGTSAKPMSTTYSSEFNSSSAAGPVSRAYSSEYQGSGGSAGALKLPSSQNAESFNCGLQQQVQQSSRAEMSQSSQQQLLNKQKEIENQALPARHGAGVSSTVPTVDERPGSISVTSSSSHSLQSLPEERKEELEESAMTKTTAMPVGLWDFTLPPAYRPSNTSGSSGSAQASNPHMHVVSIAEGQHASEASVQATSSGALNAGRSWATSSGSTKLDAFGDADLTAVGDGSHGAKSECCGRVQAEAAALREKVQGMDELLKSQSRKMMVLHKQLDEKEQESVELRAQLQKLQAQVSRRGHVSGLFLSSQQQQQCRLGWTVS
ncbi:unnamed protein product [Lampetra planeri]